MKYKCPKCGAIFSGENDHCPKCGLKLKYRGNEQETPKDNPDIKANEQVIFNQFKKEQKPKPTPTPDVNKEVKKPEKKVKNEEQKAPKTPLSKNAKGFYICGIISMLVAAGIMVGTLFLPIFGIDDGGGVAAPLNGLDYYVYVVEQFIAADEMFWATITDKLYYLVPTAVTMLMYAIAAIVILVGLILYIVFLAVKHQPTKKTVGFGVTPSLVLGIAAINLTVYLPVFVNNFVPAELPPVETINQLWMAPLYGGYAVYFVTRLIQNINKAKL